eukprot:CAMPEP_0118709370 /NCGR_PEP_ID=MMETSP0800-20121206/22596_1 /TAXON_ID=210618 ORGANISM="Striatella unipunctata, Strain CCMP2910" /NCGR_SAMPLE_ID=MMETSP0800 /ASSEMBLY_ACC=CAM_ASM_000638 /LENGTH=154 /DNA_ID=CAMNT_0006613049 /DNA_START=46 /DNA_END=506 /DNA_ORIENTATION=-
MTNELSLGQNVLVGYVPWQGYNFEDAVLINERLVYEDIFTSLHIERYQVRVEYSEEVFERVTKEIPGATEEAVKNLSEEGIVVPGTYVNPGDILVGKISNFLSFEDDRVPETKLLKAIFGVPGKDINDRSYRMPLREHGKILETVVFNRKSNLG